MLTSRNAVNDGAPSRSDDFAEWVRPHVATMRRYAAVLDPARDPDDLVQDSLERAWARWETYSSERGSARTWLLAILADRARRSRVRSQRLNLVDLDPDLAAEQASTDRSELLDVRRAVEQLPSRQRHTVVLFYYVDLTVAETAAALGCSAGTVKSTLSDARANLAKLLGEQP